MPRRQWSVAFHPKCEAWAYELAQADAEALLAAIRILRDEGQPSGDLSLTPSNRVVTQT